jgi:signal transduction histidine kinase
MRWRPRRAGFGLRGRILGVVLVTAVATLVVAAVALLGPLQHSLRDAELTTLKEQVTGSQTARFRNADPAKGVYPPIGSQAGGVGKARKPDAAIVKAVRAKRLQLYNDERDLASSIGASDVAILGNANAAGGAAPVATPLDPDLAGIDPYDDAAAAFRSNKSKYTLGTIGGVQYARAAIPFSTTGLTSKGATYPQRWMLVVRKPLDEVSNAVSAIRKAFLYAALAALFLTLVLGIPLSGRLIRRLRRLSQAALQVAQAGPATDVPVDRTRDEVGDLSRAFTIMGRRLRQQEEARRAFVATASHELRTPLTSLEGMLELLDEDLGEQDPDLADARLLLARARAQSRRLGRLAADLLDLSRIDAEIELRSEPVEFGELSRAVLAEFELGTAARGLASVLDDSAGPVWALGDPGSVARILRILLENAVRVSPEGSHIRVELRNGDRATLSVCDEGPGVPIEERELIFERFKRGRETGGQAGFGLGLAIGRELARRMGGELVLEDPPDGGATFTLRLPTALAPEREPLLI